MDILLLYFGIVFCFVYNKKPGRLGDIRQDNFNWKWIITESGRSFFINNLRYGSSFIGRYSLCVLKPYSNQIQSRWIICSILNINQCYRSSIWVRRLVNIIFVVKCEQLMETLSNCINYIIMIEWMSNERETFLSFINFIFYSHYLYYIKLVIKINDARQSGNICHKKLLL